MTAPTGTRGRRSYDPFAPGSPTFPDRRLLRAGVDEETVERLRGEYADMSPRNQTELARFVTRNTDRRIAERFQGRRSREDLQGMTVEQIEPLLRERNLSTSGRKAELIDRLVASYEPASAPQSPPEPAPAPETPAPAPEAGSGDVEPPAAPSAPEAPAEPGPAAPATPETPAATPAPDPAVTADPTTTEEAPRG